MNDRRASVLAWSMWAFAMIVGGVGLWLNILDMHQVSGSFAPQEFLIPGYATVGAIVASKSRKNAIGWLFLGVGVLLALVTLTFSYAVRAVGIDPGSLPAGVYAGWVSNWLFPLNFVALAFLLLLFPDGHLPSRRWRPVAWALALTWGWFVVFAALAPGSITVAEYTFDNPVPWSPLGRPPLSYVTPNWNGPATVVLTFLGFGLLVAAAAAPFVRWRGADAEGRLQLRWFAYATAATALTGVLAAVVAGVAPDVAGWLAIVPLAGAAIAIPVAVGIGVLKYRLYEIDIVVNKTVVYAGLAAFITIVYVGIVVGIGSLLGSGDRPNVPLSIAATAVVAVAFQPVRALMQRLANHLVYGNRATPYEVLSEFSERVGDAYATDDLMPRMARVLAEGTGAQRSDVWLVVSGRLRPEASWPQTATVPDPLFLEPFPDGLYPVRHQGELLGALSFEKRPGESITATEEKLVEDLAGQAGLVLRNVRLTEALLERLDELKASRLRLVAAQDEERRKLERNLHDGAQQQLVALSVKARLAQQLARRDPEQVEAILEQIQADTGDALENLRDLARGIYPPLLADQGLVAALEAQARKAALPTTVTGDGVGRFGQDIEAAVYFSCLEALQNVAKYADASRARIDLSNGDGALTFTVTDNGRGFDPDSTGYGTGLQGIADRLAALGGSMEVASAAGDGTTVTGRLPVLAAEATP